MKKKKQEKLGDSRLFTQKSPTKTLRFSGPMFSVEEELLAEEYAEKSAKKMNEALSHEEE
tara:strand:- start:208 stop:387 length:180 start_codon:yes stop_codon:yes gene_type:complete